MFYLFCTNESFEDINTDTVKQRTDNTIARRNMITEQTRVSKISILTYKQGNIVIIKNPNIPENYTIFIICKIIKAIRKKGKYCLSVWSTALWQHFIPVPHCVRWFTLVIFHYGSWHNFHSSCVIRCRLYIWPCIFAHSFKNMCGLLYMFYNLQ